MASLKKTFLFLFGLLIAFSCLFICIVTIDIMLEEDRTQETAIGGRYILWSVSFVGLTGAFLAYRSRPRRPRRVPVEHIELVRLLLKSKRGRLSTTEIFALVNLAQDEVYSVLDALRNAKEGQFGDDEKGVEIFELKARANTGDNAIKESIRRFVISSSKIRMIASFFFIVVCLMVLVTARDEPYGGYVAYCIIVAISIAVILSGSYMIGYLKKRKGM